MAEGNLSEQQICSQIHPGDTIRYYTGVLSGEAEAVVEGFYSSGTPGSLSEGVLIAGGLAVPGREITQVTKANGDHTDFH